MKDQDLLLIDNILKGDRRAENEIIIKYDTDIRNFLYHKCGVNIKEDLDDLVQEICIKVLEKLRQNQFDYSSTLKTFIIGITKKVFLNWRRKYATQNKLILSSIELHNLEPVIENPESLRETISVENKELLDSYHKFINTLADEKTRLIMKLISSQSLTYVQIARLLNLTATQVSNKYHYVKIKLKDAIQGVVRSDIKRHIRQLTNLDDYYLLMDSIRHDYRYFDIDLAMTVLHNTILEQVPDSDSIEVKRLRAKSLLFLAELDTTCGNIVGKKGSIAKSRIAFKIFNKLKDVLHQVHAKHIEAQGYYITRELKKSLKCYETAFNLIKRLSSFNLEAKEVYSALLRDKGTTLWRVGNFIESENFLKLSLNFSEYNNLDTSIQLAKMRLGEYYVFKNFFSDAFPFIEQVENSLPKKHLVGQIIIHKIWATFHFHQLEFDHGLSHFNKALEISQNNDFKSHLRDLENVKHTFKIY